MRVTSGRHEESRRRKSRVRIKATNETMTAWEGLTTSEAYASSRLMRGGREDGSPQVAHPAHDHHDERAQR